MKGVVTLQTSKRAHSPKQDTFLHRASRCPAPGLKKHHRPASCQLRLVAKTTSALQLRCRGKQLMQRALRKRHVCPASCTRYTGNVKFGTLSFALPVDTGWFSEQTLVADSRLRSSSFAALTALFSELSCHYCLVLRAPWCTSHPLQTLRRL